MKQKNTKATLNQTDIIDAMLGGAVLIRRDGSYTLAMVDGSDPRVTPGRVKTLSEKGYLRPLVTGVYGHQWALWPHAAERLSKQRKRR